MLSRLILKAGLAIFFSYNDKYFSTIPFSKSSAAASSRASVPNHFDLVGTLGILRVGGEHYSKMAVAECDAKPKMSATGHGAKHNTSFLTLQNNCRQGVKTNEGKPKGMEGKRKEEVKRKLERCRM